MTHPLIQTYTYDSLYRLSTATETKNSVETWEQAFAYDRYGNPNFDEANTSTLPKECNGNTEVCAAIRPLVNPSVSTTNNRLNGYIFDDSGNTTEDAEERTFIYDGENKMVEVKNSSNVTVGLYYYDGDGKRVKKIVTGGETTLFVYDAGGKMIGEYSTQLNQTPQVSYLTTDTLGSPRVNTDENGAIISRHDYHPFGEEIVGSGGRTQGLGYQSDDNRKQFTGYERDNESGLDFAQARYYSHDLGRFTTTDPIYITENRLLDPQQINIYLYARNNPARFVDPTGLDISIAGGEDDWALDELRKGLSYGSQITTNEQNVISIVDANGKILDPKNKKDKKVLEKMGKSLEGAEKELFNAIIDTKVHSTLTAEKDSNSVDVGQNVSPGNNSVDRADVELLAEHSGRGGFSASDVVKHEAMEAYLTAKKKKTIFDDKSSHENNPFEGITSGSAVSLGNVRNVVGTSSRGDYSITTELDKGQRADGVPTGKVTKIFFVPKVKSP